MTRLYVVTLFTIALFGTTARGEEVRLRHQLQENSRYQTEVFADVQQTLTIAGMDTETSVQTQMLSQAEIGGRGADGMLRVKEQITSLDINMGGTAGDYAFASSQPDDSGSSALEMFRPVHKLLAKRQVTFVYGEDNLVQKVETDENVFAGLPVELQALVQDQMDGDAIKSQTNQVLKSLPAKPVRPGDTWQRTEVANFGAGQEMTFEVTYTYEGTEQQDGKQLDKISQKVNSVDFSLADNAALPLSLKDSDLKAEASTGVVLFDRQAGRIVKTRSKTRITGPLTFVANGQELPSQLDLTIDVESSVKFE